MYASLMAQTVENLPAMQETLVWSLVGKIPWRRERLPTPVFWPGEFHERYNPWGHKESDTTEWLSLTHSVKSSPSQPPAFMCVTYLILSVQFSRSVISDSATMGCSTPGFPAYYQLLELAQTHVHRVGEVIQPAHPVIPFSSRLQSFPASGSSNESVLCIR